MGQDLHGWIDYFDPNQGWLVLTCKQDKEEKVYHPDVGRSSLFFEILDSIVDDEAHLTAETGTALAGQGLPDECSNYTRQSFQSFTKEWQESLRWISLAALYRANWDHKIDVRGISIPQEYLKYFDDEQIGFPAELWDMGLHPEKLESMGDDVITLWTRTTADVLLWPIRRRALDSCLNLPSARLIYTYFW